MVTVAKLDGAVTYSAFSGCQNKIRCLNSEGPRWIHQDSKDLRVLQRGLGSIQLLYLGDRGPLNLI